MPTGAFGAAWLFAAKSEGACCGSGGKDSPNWAYRSEGPCRPVLFS